MCEKWRHRQACASAHSRERLYFSHTGSMDTDVDSAEIQARDFIELQIVPVYVTTLRRYSKPLYLADAHSLHSTCSKVMKSFKEDL